MTRSRSLRSTGNPVPKCIPQVRVFGGGKYSSRIPWSASRTLRSRELQVETAGAVVVAPRATELVVIAETRRSTTPETDRHRSVLVTSIHLAALLWLARVLEAIRHSAPSATPLKRSDMGLVEPQAFMAIGILWPAARRFLCGGGSGTDPDAGSIPAASTKRSHLLEERRPLTY